VVELVEAVERGAERVRTLGAEQRPDGARILGAAGEEPVEVGAPGTARAR
jgi:hypothetical protein